MDANLKKALFTIDSILCANQKKDSASINENNTKCYENLKTSTKENKEKNEKGFEKCREEKLKNDLSNNTEQSNDSYSDDSLSNSNLIYTKIKKSNKDENTSPILKQDKFYQQNLTLTNPGLIFNTRSSASYNNNNNNIDHKNNLFSQSYSDELTSKTTATLKNIICSTIKYPKIINDSLFDPSNATMQCLLQSNQQDSVYQQNGNFSNNFQYCFPGLLPTTSNQNYNNGFQSHNPFVNYNQLLAINSGKDLTLYTEIN
jgi:hypothetical protein